MRVIVVGAGPGGATAALELARAGWDVVLAEKSGWPRPKTCGDGISPHAIELGRSLGFAFEGSVHLERAVVSTPRETAFVGGWPAATPWGTTIERVHFDASLVDGAVAAGVTFLSETTVSAIVRGRKGLRATLRSARGESTLEADVAILAEGATGGLAAKLGFPPHRSRLVALRGYAHPPATLEPKYGLFYDRLVTPGYGWVFPMDERRANVGICVDERLLAKRGGNVRTLFARWLRESRFALELLGDAPEVLGIVGGVIPSGRRERARRGVFLVGDAAGVADPFTAEGIYQAMASARMAARALIASPRRVRRAERRYERALRVFDRNERASRALRATFGIAIEPYARHAARHPAFADHLNTDVFLPKRGFLSFVWRLSRAW